MECLNLQPIQGCVLIDSRGEAIFPKPVEAGQSDLSGQAVCDARPLTDMSISAETLTMLDTLHQTYNREELALYLLFRAEINPHFVGKVLPSIVAKEKQQRTSQPKLLKTY